MSKGSKRRPGDEAAYRDGWDRVFGGAEDPGAEIVWDYDEYRETLRRSETLGEFFQIDRRLGTRLGEDPAPNPHDGEMGQ
jgi:hypothetical protein